MSDIARSSYIGYIDAIREIAGECCDVVFLENGRESSAVSPRPLKVSSAEQDIILTAAGLALGGYRVFVTAPFNPLLIASGYEQIRASVVIPNLKVVLSLVHGGDVLDQDGAARQICEDFALMRVLPNMAVLAPADRRSSYSLTRSLLSCDGPAYIRLSYSDVCDIYAEDDSDFHIGGARLLTEGDGVTICSVGIMVSEALKASKVLAQQGINAEIIDCYSIKPFPEQTLLASVRRTGCCVVAERHTNIGGLYGAVTECLCRSYTVPVRSVSVQDSFGQSGTPEELQEYYGLTHREIVHNVIQVWAMRRR
ncbi:MAG: transketolase [Synergistaceae bacterium]|jgi:transketolase|nr:transketolase [Synergistaceae bacterium]